MFQQPEKWKHTNLTYGQKQQLIKDYETADLTRNQLSARYNVHRATVSRILAKQRAEIQNTKNGKQVILF